MNRRRFLQWLGGTAAGVAAAPYLDVDKLLWVPGEKTIFVPPPPTLATDIALTTGDVFTIAGRYAVNPITRRATNVLQQFVVTRDVSVGRVPTRDVWPTITESLPKGAKVQPLHVGRTVPMRTTQPLFGMDAWYGVDA